MAVFPSEGWLQDWADTLNASPEYGKAAATWEGDVSLVIDADVERGFERELRVWVDLWHGACRGCRYDLDPEEGRKARFVMRAPYNRWKAVVRGELDPVKAIVLGKIKLKGDMAAIVRHVKAAKAMVVAATTVDVQFIDEK